MFDRHEIFDYVYRVIKIIWFKNNQNNMVNVHNLYCEIILIRLYIIIILEKLRLSHYTSKVIVDLIFKLLLKIASPLSPLFSTYTHTHTLQGHDGM